MAAEALTSTPIIIQPPSPSSTSPHASLVNSSLDPNSPSNSDSSSRPHSQDSSHTSLSEQVSPIEGQSGIAGNVTSQDTIQLSELHSEASQRRSSGISPINHLLGPHGNNSPRLNPPPPSPTNTDDNSQLPHLNNQPSWVSSIRTRIHRRRWVENTIGVLGLATALWLGVRGYKLAVWQSWNDLRQTCAAYKQSGIALSPRCMKILEGDPPDPPYWLPKWAVDMSNSTASSSIKREIPTPGKDNTTFQDDPPARTYTNVPSSMVMICIIVVFGLLLIWKARGRSKNEKVFTCPARSNVPNLQFTRHLDHGPETVTGHGVLTKHRPEDKTYPGDIRRRLRSSQDHNSQDMSSLTESSRSSYSNSVETLGVPQKEARKPSVVSLQDHSANEKHEGLIELDVNGKRKAFFKPSTGEFFHIAPWKSTHSDDDSSDEEHRVKQKASEKYRTQRVLGQMVAGGVSWAAGKSVNQTLAEGLQSKVNHRSRGQPPQRVGDSLAGEVTNEWQ